MSMSMSVKTSRHISMVFQYAFLLILAAFILYPLMYVIFGSFKENQELLSCL